VYFFQENGLDWRPFTYEEINAFYQKKRKDFDGHFIFNQLVEPEEVLANQVEEFVRIAQHAELYRSDPLLTFVNYLDTSSTGEMMERYETPTSYPPIIPSGSNGLGAPSA
jgi:hypothetical protein